MLSFPDDSEKERQYECLFRSFLTLLIDYGILVRRFCLTGAVRIVV